MSLTSILFLSVVMLLACLSLIRGPLWGFVGYVFVYILSPSVGVHWWGRELPDIRYSLFFALIWAVSIMLHPMKVNKFFSVNLRSFIYIFLFMLLSLAVTVIAVDSYASTTRCYEFFRFLIVMCFIYKTISSSKDLQVAFWVLLLLTAIVGFETLGAPRISGRLEGVGPPDANDSNNLALFFVAIVPLGIPLFLFGNKIEKIIVVICEVLILNGIILANSRGAIIALFICVIVLGFYIRHSEYKKYFLLLTVVGGFGFLYLTDIVFIERMGELFSMKSEDGGSGRLEIWGYSLNIIPDYPLGTGGDGFRRLSAIYLPEELLSFGNERVPHNTFLLIAIEQGMLGLGLYCLFFFSLFRLLIVTIHTVVSPLLLVTTIALVGSLVGHVSGSFFGDRLYYELIYILAGFVPVVAKLATENNNDIT